MLVWVWVWPVGGGAAAPEAQYHSAFCQGLQSQYVSLRRQSGSGGGNVQVLSRQLRQAQAAAQSGNCTRFFLFARPDRSPACPATMATIGILQRQLLNASGRGFGGFASSPDFERARLRDALIQSGCGIPTTTNGVSRTLCVRVCDGYYFPISNVARRSRYATDAAVCQSMYAEEGQAELFVQSSGAKVDRAVSLDGKRYADQPYAFGYRQSYDMSCHSQLKTGIAALAVRYLNAPPIARNGKANVTIPTSDPKGIDGGEALDATEVSAVAVPEAEFVRSDEAPASPEPNRLVRFVGDPYYTKLFDLSRPETMKHERTRTLHGGASHHRSSAATASYPPY